MTDELPMSIIFNGKRATLLVERLRASCWTAEYCYKQYPSKNGGHNTHTVVVMVAPNELYARRKLLNWYLAAKNTNMVTERTTVKERREKAKAEKVHATGRLDLNALWNGKN